MPDHVDFVVAQWAAAVPELDASSMQVFGRLARLVKHVERARGQALERFGFKEGEFDVLATLRRAGAPYRLSPTQLYRSLLVTSGAMTNRLARLETAGLVSRHADACDRRSSWVQLSAAGLAHIDAALQVHTQVQNDLLGGLDQPQREALGDLLRSLLLALPGEPLEES